MSYAVRAHALALDGKSRGLPYVTEEFETEAAARACFVATLKEGGFDLHSIGWGEHFAEGEVPHVEWVDFISGQQIRKALESLKETA